MVIKSSSAAERTTPKRSVALAVSTAVRRTSLRTSRRLSKLMVDLQQGDLPPELCSWLHLSLVLEGGLSGPQHLPELTCVRYCAIQRMRMFRCLHDGRRYEPSHCTFFALHRHDILFFRERGRNATTRSMLI